MFYGNKILRTWMLISALAILAGCSGGGEGDVIGTGGKPKVQISGTAAEGAPIGDAPVTVKAEDGVKKSTRTLGNGRFQIEAEGAGPFLMRVEKGGGKSLFSIASRGGNTNIHPFTDLIIRNWFKVQGLDLESEFDSAVAPAMLPTPAEIADIENAIRRIIQQALIRFGLPGELDLISAPFDANSTGFDLFLDFSSVVINNNTINIVLTDQETNIENPVVSDVDLATDFTEADDSAPDMPENLRAVPASASEIVVVWDPTTDNVGVAGYRIYRNGELVETTPYPVYFDSGLSPNTPYCYQIEAFDGAENSSARAETPQPCPLTLGSDDTTAPDTPTGMQAVTEGSSTISLSWMQTTINDVYGFKVYRGTTVNNINELVATVTSTSYTDYNLEAGSEYCYQVSAFDAADNNSSRSTPPACATTEGGTNPGPTGDSLVEFSSATYQVTETGAVAIITVNRSGDISAPITVDYTTVNGTATEGQDYNAASGTLTWGSNDGSPQTIRVQVKPDTVTDDNETLTVSLSNYSANAGPGSITNTTVTISDAECPGVLSANITQSTTISECTVVTAGIYVSNGTLTINPGVTLIFEPGNWLEIQSTGSLSAVGTVNQPILFTGQQTTTGSWDGISIRDSNNVINALDYVMIEYGGTAGVDAALEMIGSTNANRIKIRNTTFRESLGYGFAFDDATIVDEFVNVTSTANAQGPAYLPADLVGSLDGGSDYSGNTVDRVIVQNVTYINNNQTWAAINVPYSIGGSYVYANLVIAAGAELEFRTGGWLEVTSSGSMSAVGTADQPIIFTGEQTTAGFWDGISYRDSNSVDNTLDYVVVEYGGTSGVDAALEMIGSVNANRIKIRNTTFRESLGYGFAFDDATIVDEFVNVTSTANAQGPAYLPADLVGSLDGSSDYSGNAVDRIIVQNVTYINNDQTWAAVNVPYSIGGSYVYANLVIAAGAELEFRTGGWLEITSSGSMSAVGTADQPIIFTGEQTTAGFWDGISFRDSNNVNNALDYVVIEYGGTSGVDAALEMIGSVNANRIKISNTTLRESLGYGFAFDDATIVDEFVNVTSTSNTQGPGYLPADLVGSLDETSNYSGNTVDRVIVQYLTHVNNDQTWSAIDVPYSLSGTYVYASLVIEAGAILEFQADGWMDVPSSGSLTAVGTVDQRIVFTGEQITAGYWDSLSFTGSNNANNILDYVTVEYAGSGGATASNIELVGSVNTTRVTITNSIIQNSLGYGIRLGSAAEVNADIATSNTYLNNATGDYCVNNGVPACQ